MFDECHKAKNATSTKMGKAGLDLQNKLPLARVVYASATGEGYTHTHTHTHVCCSVRDEWPPSQTLSVSLIACVTLSFSVSLSLTLPLSISLVSLALALSLSLSLSLSLALPWGEENSLWITRPPLCAQVPPSQRT